MLYLHTHTHTPDSSPRETWLLWRQSNQAAVTMETEVIGPFCMCVRPLTFSVSGYHKATTALCAAFVREAGVQSAYRLCNMLNRLINEPLVIRLSITMHILLPRVAATVEAARE